MPEPATAEPEFVPIEDFDPEEGRFTTREVVQLTGTAPETIAGWRTAGYLRAAGFDLPDVKQGKHRHGGFEFWQVAGFMLTAIIVKQGIPARAATMMARNILEAVNEHEIRVREITLEPPNKMVAHIVSRTTTGWTGVEFTLDPDAGGYQRAEPDTEWIAWFSIDMRVMLKWMAAKLTEIRSNPYVIKRTKVENQ